MVAKFDGYPHITASQQFSPKFLGDVLFPMADQMEKRELIGNVDGMLAGKEMVSFFVAESLRTRASFEIGFRRLGGQVIFGSEAAKQFSSIGKGEGIEDAIATLNEYLGLARKEKGHHHDCVIVLRTDKEGDAEKAKAVSDVPIINAGDGQGQHPTQALLDLYTIHRHLGRINGISIAMIGDLAAGRTIHSLAYLLGKYQDVTMYFVSPEHLRMRPKIIEHLVRHKVKVHEMRDIREVAGDVDVFYQTRTQTNLGTEPWDRTDPKHGFTVIDKGVLDLAKKDAIIMHPLPCNKEIVRAEVDNDPRAIYLKTRGDNPSQVKCGLYIREAIFKLILAPDPD